MTFQRDLAWQHLEHTYRSSVSYQFARYALALNFSLIPEHVVHQAKRCVLDALGCAIGAYEAPGRAIIEATAKQIGGAQEATVFCTGLRTSALNASLVNAFLVRYLDSCDLGGGGHNADALSSILAVAEREKSSAKDFLTSLVISYELGARFKESITASLGEVQIKKSISEKGLSGDIRAGLNQPPALGKLMGLSEDQIANAIGLCMSHALPLNMLDANREEYTMAKNLRFGWTAHDALLSCMLAKNGFTGPVRVIESDYGIRKVLLQGDMDLERLIDFSGWRILKTKFKSLCTNGTNHGTVLASMELAKEHDLKPENIASVHVTAATRNVRHTTTAAKKYPRNGESADHSTYYGTAVAIKERAFGPDAFKPEKYTDPVILELIEKITVEIDPDFGPYQAQSEITTKDGRSFTKRIDMPHGFGDDPLTDKDLEVKFNWMAEKYLPKEHINKLIDMCWNLEKLDDLSKLTKLMVFPGSKL